MDFLVTCTPVSYETKTLSCYKCTFKDNVVNFLLYLYVLLLV